MELEEQLINLLSFDKKIYGKELAWKLKIDQTELRKLIAKVRRNWKKNDYFIVGNKTGYWLTTNEKELKQYWNKTFKRYLGTMEELKSLGRVILNVEQKARERYRKDN